MTFLSPSLLWGLAAAAIPLIIHLISLRQTKEMEFSSILFLKEMKHESIRKLKIKQWLLILIRTLIIISLVLMLARPSTKGIMSTWMGEVDSRAVIVIDNSASMSLVGDDVSLLENAKFQAKSVIRKLDEKTIVEIYQTNPLKQIFKGHQDRIQSISNAINSISQTVTADHLWDKMKSILASVEQSEINKECFIFSDFQSIPDSTMVNLVHQELKDWKLYLIGQETVKDNIGIYEVLPVSQVKLQDHLMKLNTLVTNEGEIEKRNIPIELFLNDERVGQVVTSFRPGKAKEFLFQVYPGASGIIRGMMTIPEDDFAFDNRQTFEMSIPKQISCTVVGRSFEDIFLLEQALQSIDGNQGYVNIHRKFMSKIDKLFLDDTDVLILHRPKYISDNAVDEIQRFAARGGGIIWIADIENYSLDASVESALKLPAYVQTFTTEGESFYSVKRTHNQHALFADLMVRRMADEMPEVYSYSRVRPRLNQNIILSLNNGDPYLLEYRLIGGHVFYLTSPIGIEWNDLALRGIFVPMLHRMLILLATDESNTLPVYAGDKKEISLPKELINAKWEVYSPSGYNRLLIPDYNQEVVVIEQTNELGSYEVYANNELYIAFSTMLDPNERPINRIHGQTLVDIMGSEQILYFGPGEKVSDVLYSLRYGKALWRNFLILAIILMLLDTLIGRPNLNALKVKRSEI
ncbi:MAG: BatA domain-containing protein [Candidatus Marinimicrobia bacterium]|nr:BatA domain-containing protein [Candidatus Neomarinimicrobiota bacterium]